MAKKPSASQPNSGANDAAPADYHAEMQTRVRNAHKAVIDQALDRMPKAGVASYADLRSVLLTTHDAFAAALSPPELDVVEPAAEAE